jgi:predicted Zn-dependent protease with MMP-like domain
MPPSGKPGGGILSLAATRSPAKSLRQAAVLHALDGALDECTIHSLIHIAVVHVVTHHFVYIDNSVAQQQPVPDEIGWVP